VKLPSTPPLPASEERITLPDGVIRVRIGPGANCSSAGSAIDLLFYGSAVLGAIAVALAATLPVGDAPSDGTDREDEEHPPPSTRS